ncbi:hypothetical protein CVV65_13480 [Kyrpidia spormannii]|uniref:CRISPR-associated protein Cas6 C-terminal domain-containing protein n=2 Tax=Kyrpidia spormannii TaxID=2055160 RepID=A0A2K8NE88_9BACL|nr:hypothetical protein CVV65_13480 [Kyrpidia spormannii]
MALREFAEATLRGGFGTVFREQQCVALGFGEGLCRSGCRYSDACPVAAVFAPGGGGEELDWQSEPSDAGDDASAGAAEPTRRSSRHPRDFVAPYILYMPKRGSVHWRPGEHFSFDLTLVGRAMGYLQHFIEAFQALFQRGVGGRRDVGVLESVEALGTAGNWLVYSKKQERFGTGVHPYHVPVTAAHLETETVFSGLDRPPGRVTLVFETPFRTKWQGALVSRPDFHVVLRAAVRRISRLMEQHCGTHLDIPYTSLFDLATEVRLVDSDVQWKEYWRFSTRQGQNMQFGGIVGAATYEGDLAPYVPFLTAGQYLHAGKQAVFGFGRYRCLWG